LNQVDEGEWEFEKGMDMERKVGGYVDNWDVWEEGK